MSERMRYSQDCATGSALLHFAIMIKRERISRELKLGIADGEESTESEHGEAGGERCDLQGWRHPDGIVGGLRLEELLMLRCVAILMALLNAR